MFKSDYSIIRKALKFVSWPFSKNFDFSLVYTLEKIHFFDNIKKPELLERINAMNYEGGIYSPYNALFYAAVTALRSGETFHQNAGAREHTGVSHKSSLS